MKKSLLILLSVIWQVSILSAQNFWKTAIKGEGPIVTKEITLSEFDGIRSGFSCDIIISQGSKQEVILEGQQNILDNLVLTVSDGILKIKYDRMVRRSEPVKLYITMSQLTEASMSGSGSMVTKGRFSGLGDLDLSVSGSGNVDLDVDAKDIIMKVSGSGDISLSGSADDMDIRISGSGGVDSRDLEAKGCEVSISGSGNATVYVKERLDAHVSGSGNVRYRGDVTKVNSSVSGSGSVRSY